MAPYIICLALFLCTLFPLSSAVPAARSYPVPKPRFSLRNINSAHFSLTKPFNPSLLGPVRRIIAKQTDLAPYNHPRVAMGKKEWKNLVSRHADPATFNKPNTWSRSFLTLSRRNGPDSSFVKMLANLETSGKTDIFTGKHRQEFADNAQYNAYRNAIKPLADYFKEGRESHSHSLFMCAFWASVSERQGSDHFLDKGTMKKCIDASVAWAKILMAHRTYHCNPVCNAKTADAELSYLWNYELPWAVKNDWHTFGTSLALAYDVLYQRMSNVQQKTIRSALALLVLKRFSWGTADQTSVKNPNAETHPHRIFSNWAMYHSNLYLTNLAIEGEKGFVSYTTTVLSDNNSSGFNQKLNRKWDALFKAYWEHSIYPDGASFEDGYTFHTALREGGLGLVANHRRGKNNHLDTPRFRNMIHNVAQQWEPWQCGSLVGHASGGGLSYPSYVGLIRYAYPEGALPRMLWAQRFGKSFINTAECRIWWTQTMMQLAFFGAEHADTNENIADSPETLPPAAKASFPLSYVATRRGLIIARGSHSQRTSYLHFDARTDSIFTGHDNADRGVITFAALKKRWLDDLPWRGNLESRKHTLLHIDGLAQARKAPPSTILKAVDSKNHFIASADLSYTYNVQWAPGSQGTTIGTGISKEYLPDGTWKRQTYKFTDREPNSPWDLGWPMEDDAADIGFHRGMNLNPQPDIGFSGTNVWRRLFRAQSLKHYVRSTIMVRSKKNDVGFAVLVDSVDAGPGKHVFESYFILHSDVSVDSSSSCIENRCDITLKTSGAERLDIHALSKSHLSYRVESFEGNNRRLILKSSGISKEEIWVAMHPHMGNRNEFQMSQESGNVKFVYEGEEQTFAVDESDHSIIAKSHASPSAPLTSPLPPTFPSPPIPHLPTPSNSPAPATPSSQPHIATEDTSYFPLSSPIPSSARYHIYQIFTRQQPLQKPQIFNSLPTRSLHSTISEARCRTRQLHHLVVHRISIVHNSIVSSLWRWSRAALRTEATCS